MGRNAVSSYEVFLDELRVPADRLVGEEGKGFRYLLDGINPERILLAHEALGIGRAALRRAVNYAGERVVFDRPIGQNQGVAFPLAEAAVRLEAAELMATRAAILYDAGQPCGAEANMAKWLCADAGFQAADAAVQTHGGYGYAREYHVERYFRESRLMRIAPVSQEMVLNYVSHQVLGLPKSY
jgi:acyl-CoA dehydrogenase